MTRPAIATAAVRRLRGPRHRGHPAVVTRVGPLVALALVAGLAVSLPAKAAQMGTTPGANAPSQTAVSGGATQQTGSKAAAMNSGTSMGSATRSVVRSRPNGSNGSRDNSIHQGSPH